MKRYILTFLALGPEITKDHYSVSIFNAYRITTKVYDEVVKGIMEANPKITGLILINSLELDTEDNIM